MVSELFLVSDYWFLDIFLLYESPKIKLLKQHRCVILQFWRWGGQHSLFVVRLQCWYPAFVSEEDMGPSFLAWPESGSLGSFSPSSEAAPGQGLLILLQSHAPPILSSGKVLWRAHRTDRQAKPPSSPQSFSFSSPKSPFPWELAVPAARCRAFFPEKGRPGRSTQDNGPQVHLGFTIEHGQTDLAPLSETTGEAHSLHSFTKR